MPSNLPPITQTLPGTNRPTAIETSASLSRLTGLSLGSTAMAIVEQVAPVTQSQRDLLLAQNQQLLTQLQQRPATPAVQQQILNLQDQQQLLTSPPLKLVQLQLNNRQLLTYTDQPVQVGQQMPVKLDLQQRLTQLLTATGTGASGEATATTETELSAAVKARQAADQVRLQTVLADALRTLLPQKEKPQSLMAALPELQQLPLRQREQLVPANVQQALRRVADQLRSLPQLTNPKVLATVLRNSGILFESKLAAASEAKSAAAGSSPAEQKPLLPIVPVSQANKGPVPAAQSHQLVGQDYKGALLHLLHQLDKEVKTLPSGDTRPAAPATAAPSSTAMPAVASQQLPYSEFTAPAPLQFPTALQLLQHLAARPEADLSDKVLRTQLILLLHQHTLTSLAKVRLQQLHTLNHRQTQTDNPQPTQSWLFDIPVRYGPELHQLEIRIDQEWTAEDKDERDQRDRVKQWSVMLSFNLPRLGGLYAQLTILDDTVSAKLWADQESTLAQAQASLENLRQQLQSQGVEVKQLQCLHGAPPSYSISLNYALVDIKT